VPLSGLVAGHVLLQVGENRRVLTVRAERLLDDGVDDAVPPDGGGADVRQERKGDLVPIGEVSQNLLRVVRDRRQSDAVLAEFVDPTLQLDELRAAVRSPIRGAEEYQHGAARPHDRFEGADAAGLIRKAEVRNALAHLRPEPGDVDFHASRPGSLARRRGADGPDGQEQRSWQDAEWLHHRLLGTAKGNDTAIFRSRIVR
jgi:hypothetical protein